MGGDTGSLAFLMAMLAVTSVASSSSPLIGIISSGLEGKLDDLRRGRSLVLEDNHTVIPAGRRRSST